MTIQTFEQQTDPTILKRGKEYFKNGAVVYTDQDESGFWTAEVEGSEVYSVEITLEGKDEIKTVFCDCPHEAEVCKHVAAVLFAIKERLKTIKIKPVKKAKKLTFADMVGKVTRSELQAFVEAYAGSDKKFKAQFELYFAHKDERIDLKQKYTDMVKKMIRSHTSHGFVDYHASNTLSREMYTILSKASECISTDNFKDGLTIAEVVLKQLMIQVVPNADDSSGKLGDTIMEAIELLGTVAESDLCSRGLKEYLFAFLDTELLNGDYFDYGNYGYDLFEVYRNLAVLLFKEKEFFLFIDRKTEQKTSTGYNNYRSEFFIQQKILFYQETEICKRPKNWLWKTWKL